VLAHEFQKVLGCLVIKTFDTANLFEFYFRFGPVPFQVQFDALFKSPQKLRIEELSHLFEVIVSLEQP
jgi:hypothetical protein